MHLSEVGYSLGVTTNECTVSVGSDRHGHVIKVTYATLKVLVLWDLPLPAQCSTILPQMHRNF